MPVVEVHVVEVLASTAAWALPWHITNPAAKVCPMAKIPQSASRDAVRDVVPKLVEISETVLFGDVWERPGLSKRDRSMITVASLVAMNRTEQLRGHLQRALDNGVTKDEISELITHMAFYAGWPCAMSGALVAKEIFAAKKS